VETKEKSGYALVQNLYDGIVKDNETIYVKQALHGNETIYFCTLAY
jgi:hypothetical protein